MRNAETLAAVHTHTHTHNQFNRKENKHRNKAMFIKHEYKHV